MNIKNKVAIVTGGAKRVGRAIAIALAARGARLAIHYRSSQADALHTVSRIKKMGGQAFAFEADLSQPDQIQRMVAQVLKQFGRIDILVNSASLYEETRFGGIHEKDWDSHIDANLKGPFFLAQETGKAMLKQGSGKIVNIIDSDAQRPYKHYLPYLVSKSGLVGLTYCLAKELAPSVQVNGISPGPVLLQKDWGAKIKQAIIDATPLKRIGSPQDIANGVLFCVEGADFMTGAVIPIDGGQHIL